MIIALVSRGLLCDCETDGSSAALIPSFISPCSLLQTTPAWSSPWQQWQWLPWRNVAGVSSLKQEISSSDTDNALAFVNVTFTTGGEIQRSPAQHNTAGVHYTTHGDTCHHPYNSHHACSGSIALNTGVRR